MTEKKTFRLVISVILCFVFGHAAAQNEYDEKQDKAIDIGKSAYVENQFKADNERFIANANIDSSSRVIFQPSIAIKTNLLYWIGVMPNLKYYSFLPNLEVEWFFKEKWSVVVNGAYSKWGAGGDKYFGVSSWSIEPRYWFAEHKKTQFYTGLYIQGGDFDNQNLHIDEFGNTGDFYGAGLSVGVYIPIKKRWGAEIGFRTGYEHIETDIYNREPDDYYREYSNTKNRWRITGINVSISYRFWEKMKK